MSYQNKIGYSQIPDGAVPRHDGVEDEPEEVAPSNSKIHPGSVWSRILSLSDINVNIK